MCGSPLQHGNGKSSPNIAHFCSFQIPGCNVFVLGFSQQLVSEVEVLDLQDSCLNCHVIVSCLNNSTFFFLLPAIVVVLFKARIGCSCCGLRLPLAIPAEISLRFCVSLEDLTRNLDLF